MPSKGDAAPTFTATYAHEDTERFDLESALSEAPVVLAFFPGAFTPPCTNEMVAFRDQISDLDNAGATLYGISVDSPFSLHAFRDEYALPFELVSDMSREAVEAYDLRMDVEDLGLHDVANRAIFVVNQSGTVTYEWVADEPTDEPDYEHVVQAAKGA